MSDILESLFGSREKARLIRFFILNPGSVYSFEEIIEKTKTRKESSRKAIRVLARMKFISVRSQRRVKQYMLNAKFPFYVEMHNLISASNRYPQCKSLKNIRRVGDVRLALISGVFLDYKKGKIDLILVVNNASRAKVSTLIKNIEAEVGREIRYALMDGEEFRYRTEMVDRFLTDFFEGPYEEIVNRTPNLKRFLTSIKK